MRKAHFCNRKKDILRPIGSSLVSALFRLTTLMPTYPPVHIHLTQSSASEFNLPKGILQVAKVVPCQQAMGI